MAKDFEKVTVSHARKEYICTKCGKTIKIGEEYERHWGMREGTGMYNEKLCKKCMAQHDK